MVGFGERLIKGDPLGALHGGNGLKFFELLKITVDGGLAQFGMLFFGSQIDFLSRKMGAGGIDEL